MVFCFVLLDMMFSCSSFSVVRTSLGQSWLSGLELSGFPLRSLDTRVWNNANKQIWLWEQTGLTLICFRVSGVSFSAGNLILYLETEKKVGCSKQTMWVLLSVSEHGTVNRVFEHSQKDNAN